MRVGLPQGSQITSHEVERAPMIVRGNTITLVSQERAVAVATKAIALEDGVEGGKIRVRRTGTADSVLVVVVSPNEARAVWR